MIGITKTEDVTAIFVRGGGSTVELEEGIVELLIGVFRTGGGRGG